VKGAASGVSGGGLRLIIGYKLGKAAAEFLLATSLALIVFAGRGDLGVDAAVLLQQHFTGAWAQRLAPLLVRVTSPDKVELATLGLLMDGADAVRGVGPLPRLRVGSVAGRHHDGVVAAFRSIRARA